MAFLNQVLQLYGRRFERHTADSSAANCCASSYGCPSCSSLWESDCPCQAYFSITTSIHFPSVHRTRRDLQDDADFMQPRPRQRTLLPAQEMMHAEAARLVEASYGDVLLKTLGRCYETNADMYLGNPFESALVAMRSKTHAVKTHWRVASQSLKLMSVQQELERYERCGDSASLSGVRYCCRRVARMDRIFAMHTQRLQLNAF